MAPDDTRDGGQSSWTSRGLRPSEACRQWQAWAARTIAPIDVRVSDPDRFAARWRNRDVGPLSLVELEASAQKVVHCGAGGPDTAAPAIQLVLARRGALRTRVGRTALTVAPGEFVLLDNTHFYEMEMETDHAAIDLVLPRDWIGRWLADPEPALARAISVQTGWGRPLGGLIEAMACGLDDSPFPASLLADQVGTLLTLATGAVGAVPASRNDLLAERVLRLVASDFADPDLKAEDVARELGVSVRTLQTILAKRGTSFGRELAATRLDHARIILADPRAHALQVGEVAFRCGFLDPGYFSRQFRRRYGATPREWRRGCRS